MIFKTKRVIKQHVCLLKSRLQPWAFIIVEISQGFKINIDLEK